MQKNKEMALGFDSCLPHLSADPGQVSERLCASVSSSAEWGGCPSYPPHRVSQCGMSKASKVPGVKLALSDPPGFEPGQSDCKARALLLQMGGAAAVPHCPFEEAPVQLGGTSWSPAPKGGRRWGSKAGDSPPASRSLPSAPSPRDLPSMTSTLNSPAIRLQKCMCFC